MTGCEFPDVHLGMNIKLDENDIALIIHDYIKKSVDWVRKLTGREEVKMYDLLSKDNWTPELENTPIGKIRAETLSMPDRNRGLARMYRTF